MKISFDLHIHTALSPCADNDMTPNNIVNMAAMLGLNVIAVTDHNETGNARAAMKAAEKNGLDLIVLPGMELETAEEIHNIVLFDNIGRAESFGAFVASRLPKIKNRPDIFGEQLYMDENDEITGSREHLLLTASGITINEAYRAAASFGGVIFPAHVDRDSYSVLSSLGMIPFELSAELVEISPRTGAKGFFEANRRLLGGARHFITSSDAHRLADIAEPERFIAVSAKTPGSVIETLRDMAGQ